MPQQFDATMKLDISFTVTAANEAEAREIRAAFLDFLDKAPYYMPSITNLDVDILYEGLDS